MTCPRVRVVPPSCTCGRELDITVFHGDDDIGNDLCPTCSGCGCEPNERNLMNERREEQDIEPSDDLTYWAWTIIANAGVHLGGWDAQHPEWVEAAEKWRDAWHETLPSDMNAEPAPEPDHSMCARLVPHPDDPRNRHGLQSPNGSYLTLPHDGPVFVAPDDYWRERGYAIPQPEPTVVERAAKVLAEIDNSGVVTSWHIGKAERLAERGLLVRDGEQ